MPGNARRSAQRMAPRYSRCGEAVRPAIPRSADAGRIVSIDPPKVSRPVAPPTSISRRFMYSAKSHQSTLPTTSCEFESGMGRSPMSAKAGTPRASRVRNKSVRKRPETIWPGCRSCPAGFARCDGMIVFPHRTVRPKQNDTYRKNVFTKIGTRGGIHPLSWGWVACRQATAASAIRGHRRTRMRCGWVRPASRVRAILQGPFQSIPPAAIDSQAPRLRGVGLSAGVDVEAVCGRLTTDLSTNHVGSSMSGATAHGPGIRPSGDRSARSASVSSASSSSTRIRFRPWLRVLLRHLPADCPMR